MSRMMRFAARFVRVLAVPPVPGLMIQVPVHVAAPAPGFLEWEFPELADIAEHFDWLSIND